MSHHESVDIYLVEPTLQHKHMVLEFAQEFLQNGEMINGSAELEKAATFEDWLESIRIHTLPETLPKGRVLASEFLAFRRSDEKLIGMINIRHELNDYLRTRSGHIGYSVRKSERRKGYATQMLKQALDFCQEKGINQVLLTCDKSNQASAAVIKANGGELENEFIESEGVVVQRYWVSL